ncbi:MAG: class I adenylate-forming enzyme family protein [Nocardioidaceae bacterium]
MKVRIAATNVAELLRSNAERTPEKPALVQSDTDETMTWAALDRHVSALAGGLSRAGLVGGQRVALALGNGCAFVAGYLAALRAGMVAVPLNPTSTADEIARMLADSGARLCFADPTTLSTVRAALAGAADSPNDLGDSVHDPAQRPLLVVVGGAPESGEIAYDDLAVDDAAVVTPRDRESLAVLLYTSGTSGRPRGAMLSHRALLANIDQASQTRPTPITADDVVLGVVPLCHVYGLNAVLGQVLLNGATLVLGPRFDPADTLSLVADRAVSVVPVAPPVIVAWMTRDAADLRQQLRSVRLLLSGAAPLALETARGFEELTGVDVEQGYGLTEAAPIVTSTIGTPRHKPGSSGQALPGVELKVVDEAGREVHADDPGEIWVRGDNLFSGYWPDGDGAPGPEGWLATGDIGFLDADGDLFLVDRLKELVIVSGFNVYPSEIEDVVSEVPGVTECAVIGQPDDRTGEAVVAFVVAADGVDSGELRLAVARHCEARVARFKVPSVIEVVTELPHSATGKVAKGRLRAGEARRAMGLA